MTHRILVLVLSTFLVGTGVAQPLPPQYPAELWLDKGGAIGESSTLGISMAVNPGKPFMIFFSNHKTVKPAMIKLLQPIHLFHSSQLDSSGFGYHSVAVPQDNRLVGLPLYFQGTISHGTGWWPTMVCTWLIAPNVKRRFTQSTTTVPFSGRPSDHHARVTLADGTILFCGGTVPSPTPAFLKTASVYDPTTKTARSVGDMTVGRWNHAARLLGDGTVLVVGGDTGQAIPTAELYDPQAGTFQSLGAVPFYVRSPTATVVKHPVSGKEFVLVAGGISTTVVAKAMLYDVQKRTFTTLPDMTGPRVYSRAVALAAGAVLFTGGLDANFSSRADAELFLLLTGRFYPWGKLNQPRAQHGVVAVSGSQVLLIGGTNGTTDLKSVELFDALHLSSTLLPHRLHFGRYDFNPVVLSDGSILIAGGSSRNDDFIARNPELLSASGIILLRPIGERQPLVDIQALKGGRALAFGWTGTFIL